MAKAINRIAALGNDNVQYPYRPVTDSDSNEASWASRTSTWAHYLRYGTDTAWAGVLLCIVPNLEDLTIDMSRRGMVTRLCERDFERLERYPIASLFGDSGDTHDEFDLTLIPGLRKLK
ncbi:hypothetical protein K491DRAFT_721167 [Lophiostoma macrostomum CBS 122681]|uniref:Uncharacterized protein n=1 Tax=Lophiostoma macrostomum CBS 122681 TaxID=1314788 RepID=A0A6A6SU57_9PLEO|nr:hypothetical protein K491DRAFT_721167 [Lophiostoma macrostomum CBS 122681]